MIEKVLRIASSIHWLSLAINNNLIEKLLNVWIALEFIGSELSRKKY